MNSLPGLAAAKSLQMGIFYEKDWNTHLQGCVPESPARSGGEASSFPCKSTKPTPGLEPGTPSLRGKDK
jgi:hypothetical protein